MRDSSDIQQDLEEKNRKWWLGKKTLLGGIGLALLIFGLLSFLIITSGEDDQVEIISSDDQTKSDVVIDVSGAVQNPDMYILEKGARINDALIAAGGLSAEADRDWVAKSLNLARLVKDGEKIFVKSLNQQTGNSQIQGVSSFVQSEPDNCVVNINTASAPQLDKLPGIGQVLSQRIIEYRDQNGLYSNLEDLLKIPGISTNLFGKIKSQICL